MKNRGCLLLMLSLLLSSACSGRSDNESSTQDNNSDHLEYSQRLRAIWLGSAIAASLNSFWPTKPLADSETARAILGLFQHIVKTEGVTLLAATHDNLVDEYADEIVHLDDGAIRLRPPQ